MDRKRSQLRVKDQEAVQTNIFTMGEGCNIRDSIHLFFGVKLSYLLP